MFELMGVNM